MVEAKTTFVAPLPRRPIVSWGQVAVTVLLFTLFGALVDIQGYKFIQFAKWFEISFALVAAFFVALANMSIGYRVYGLAKAGNRRMEEVRRRAASVRRKAKSDAEKKAIDRLLQDYELDAAAAWNRLLRVMRLRRGIVWLGLMLLGAVVGSFSSAQNVFGGWLWVGFCIASIMWAMESPQSILLRKTPDFKCALSQEADSANKHVIGIVGILLGSFTLVYLVAFLAGITLLANGAFELGLWASGLAVALWALSTPFLLCCHKDCDHSFGPHTERVPVRDTVVDSSRRIPDAVYGD